MAVVGELEAYIKKVGMPTYLQANARAEALKQVNNRLISEVGDILDGVDFELIPDNLEYDEGRHSWEFTAQFTEAYLAPSVKTLSDDEQADFEAFQRLLKDLQHLNAKGYHVLNTLKYGRLDAPLDELAERLVMCRSTLDIGSWYAPQEQKATPTTSTDAAPAELPQSELDWIAEN